MADKKFDGVIEAAHFAPDGQVEWVRAYLRRGPTWSDRVILQRQELIDELKSGRRMMIGKRVEFMAGTFEVTVPVKLAGTPGKEVLVVSSASTAVSAASADCDHLEGIPLL